MSMLILKQRIKRALLLSCTPGIVIHCPESGFMAQQIVPAVQYLTGEDDAW
jgi:hypothetical protein